MSPVELTEIIRNISLAVSAPAGAGIAWRGLASWRDEKKWMRDTELAQNLLVALFERRDAVGGVRNTFISMSYDSLNDDVKQYQETCELYGKRLVPLTDARKKFYQYGNEARALWGDDLNALLKPIISLEADLLVVIDEHLQRLNPKADEEDDRDKDEKERDRSILYSRSKSDFTDQYATAVEKVEVFLREKMKL
ncbi:MAG: hypothetical protein ABJL99_22885 [Aliishimia sp.]